MRDPRYSAHILLGGGVPDMPSSRPVRVPPRRPWSDPGWVDPILQTACPKCGAAPGEPCKRDNRRHPYHLARVEAAGV